MPGSQRVAYGNTIYDTIIAPTSAAGATPGTLAWSAATVAANTTSELTTKIPGLLPGDVVDLYLNNGPMTTGLQIANVRTSAADTLAVTWANSTGGALTVPTSSWLANISRPEGGLGSLPPNFA
jgi:hypothetical protein